MKFFNEKQFKAKKMPIPTIKCVPIDEIDLGLYQRELSHQK